MITITTWGIVVVIEFLGYDIHEYHCHRYMHNRILWVLLSVPNCVFVCNIHEVTKETSLFTK